MQNFCDQNITIQNEAKREAIEVTVTALSKLYKEWLKISWIVAFPIFFISLVFCFKVFTSTDRVIKKQPPEVFYEKSCSQKFIRKHLWRSLIFDKVEDLTTSLKRDSDTGVFLWILRHFREHQFLTLNIFHTLF